ncbi:heme-degrading domain-containing protein [Cellulomonas sp. JZ18]|uniref:heme-degrading domain-containing protein n=1 Tax=Cellulomonas sp. JZ18 TaxID=2654191 RepID=UPI0012D450CE|nr:heme-degrading domain-containing protein [Cellulomonas sp. JZ18]QGQ17989.1 heme-degrading domain-containing protein [Cellulomonas sp. JZ18]
MDETDLAALVARLEQDETARVLPRFTNDDAWWLGTWVRDTARERGLSVVVDVRRGEHQLFHAALDGTSADNDAWVERKVRTVRRLGQSSYLVGRRLALKGQTLLDIGLDPLLFVAAGGCVPVVVDGVGPVGTLAVSGLPQADDHALAVEALAALREHQGSGAA